MSSSLHPPLGGIHEQTLIVEGYDDDEEEKGEDECGAPFDESG